MSNAESTPDPRSVIVDCASDLLLTHLASPSALASDPAGCLRGLTRYAGTCRAWRCAALERMPELQRVASGAAMPSVSSDAQASLRDAFTKHLVAYGCDEARATEWASGLSVHVVHVSSCVDRHGP
eukprot:377770-Prymnesium_polylepis.1